MNYLDYPTTGRVRMMRPLILILAGLVLVISSSGTINCGLYSSFISPIKGTAEKIPLVNRLPGIEGSPADSVKQQGKATGSKNESDDYTAMCLLERKPRWSDNPSLYFFSASNHSSSSFNCQGAERIELNISTSIYADDDEFGANNDDYDWQQVGLMDDESVVKRKLLDKESYDGSLDTYFIIHGFLASWNGDNWMCRLKDMILNNTEANVFVVDWSGGAKPMLPIDYPQAVANTRFVAKLVGDYIKWLIKISGQTNASRFHLIGHSLGAHISGFVGYSLDGSLGSITALDPAGPCFSSATITPEQDVDQLVDDDQDVADDSGAKVRRRLSPDSAKLVVALHTDTSLFGLNENCAHYNVYVNGGSQQPECASTSLAGRLGSLLQLKIGSTLSFDITCAHSFAHKMVDTIAGYASELADGSHTAAAATTTTTTEDYQKISTPSIEEEDSERQLYSVKASDRCYAMAYQCRSWEAFRSGECGYCADDDSRCVFTGLYLGREMANLKKAQTSKGRKARASNRLGFIARSIRSLSEQDEAQEDSDDDDRFNDETYPDQGDTNEAARTLNNPSDDGVSHGHHFIKTAAQAPTCLYHYQIVIAANASDVGGGKTSQWFGSLRGGKRHYFYLQIPLNQSGADLVDLDGTRKRDRLVQVSHLLKSGSRQHAELAGDPLETLRREYPSSSKLNKINPKQLDFYTALITFKSAPLEQESGTCDEAALSEKTGAWYLCRPLRTVLEARIWASNKKQLAQVQWVALNYMSGLKQAARLKRSHLLVGDPEWGIQSAREMAASLRPSIEELSPTGREKEANKRGRFNPTDLLNSPTALEVPIMNGLLKPLDCLGSSLNPLESGGSASNLKCGLTEAELKYSARLRPIKATNSKS